jgi:hypothetical protein
VPNGTTPISATLDGLRMLIAECFLAGRSARGLDRVITPFVEALT